MNKEEDGETNQEEDREKKKGDSINKSEGPTEETKFDYVMSCRRPGLGGDHELCRLGNSRKLPLYLKLEQTFPGEPPFMQKRSFPAVLRFHKFKQDTHFKEYFFSEALLYRPFQDEDQLEQEIRDIDPSLLCEEIKCVKSQVMEHLQDVQEARYFVAEAQKNDDTGAVLDPEGEQDIDDCEYEGLIDHPDYPDLDIDAMEAEVKRKLEKKHKPIELDELGSLQSRTRNLDFYQRKVIEMGIKFARGVVKSLKSGNPAPDALKLMVHGGAGSGKSKVINVLKQWVHRILQTEGDCPDCPYVMVTAPTGTAAANVKGLTLHSAFGFSFGNEHYSLSDKKRDEKRTLLSNLRLVIIDEISMVKADQLFQLDMRLREVKQKPDKLFGGVAILAFGDILQLRPCQARYIFQEPVCEDYKLAFHSGTHWQAFKVLNLVENHRQDSDRSYAEILNRIRIGHVSKEDLEVLRTRVRAPGHPDFNGAMYLSCKNFEVNKLNDEGLNKLKTPLVTAEAVNMHPTIKNFKPHVNKKGNIGTEKNETPFRQTLHMKIGARIMLSYNIDVIDGLTNGSRGEILGFEVNNNGSVDKVLIKFDESWMGEDKRISDPRLQSKYPGCTPVERVMFQYSIGRKISSGSNTARVVQFPLKLCFATTAHKFQGQTVVKPLKIVIDLRTVFGAAMAYVMMSRVQCLQQLFILGSLPEKKIYACGQALLELKRMENISININPGKWERDLQNGVKIFSLNCQSLKNKFVDLFEDPILALSDVVCLSETWLTDSADETLIQLMGFKLHTVSVGHGKGLATYFREDKFIHSFDVKIRGMQLTKLSSQLVDVISVYRSKDGGLKTLTDQIINKTTCGDVNVCLRTNKQNLLTKVLKTVGYSQLVKESTHIRGGVIDHAYFKQGESELEADVSLYSPYYTAFDHDALLIVVKEASKDIEKHEEEKSCQIFEVKELRKGS